MKKICIVAFYTLWALAIVSAIYNIKFELNVKQLREENIELITLINEKDKIIKEKDELIKEYQYGISQIEIFDECYIGE